MRTNTKKILGAVAVAGLVSTGGSAFTGTGITRGADAQAKDFVGGTVQQTVSGATLNSVGYNTTGAGTDVDSVTLTFASALSSEQTVTALVNNTESITCTEETTPAYLVYTCTLVADPGVVNTLDITVGNANTA